MRMCRSCRTPELHDAEVDVPQAVIDGLQAQVLADESAADVDPLLSPADAAVGADVAHLKAIGVDVISGSLEGMCLGEGRCIQAWRVHVQGVVWADSSLYSRRQTLNLRC